MSSLLRLLKNVFSLLTTELVNIAIRVVFTAFLVRYLSVSDFGTYTTITVFLAFGSLFADFGMSQVIVRDIAQGRDSGRAVLPIDPVCVSIHFLRYYRLCFWLQSLQSLGPTKVKPYGKRLCLAFSGLGPGNPRRFPGQGDTYCAYLLSVRGGFRSRGQADRKDRQLLSVRNAKRNEIKGAQPLAEGLVASQGAVFLTNFQPISDLILTFFLYN